MGLEARPYTDCTDQSNTRYTRYGLLHAGDWDLLVKLLSVIWKGVTEVRQRNYRENKCGEMLACDGGKGESRQRWKLA